MCAALPLSHDTQEKLALFCQVPAENVVGVHNVSNIYMVPLLMQDQVSNDMYKKVCDRLKIVTVYN